MRVGLGLAGGLPKKVWNHTGGAVPKGVGEDFLVEVTADWGLGEGAGDCEAEKSGKGRPGWPEHGPRPTGAVESEHQY